MGRATVLKRFELSPEAAAELEVEAQEGRTSQTAIIQAWLDANLADRLARQSGRTPASPDDFTGPEWKALMNTPVRFGLVQQGHIPTIERMLADGQPWDVIAKEIGWEAKTLIKHWGWYQEHKADLASPDVQNYTPEEVAYNHESGSPCEDVVPVISPDARTDSEYVSRADIEDSIERSNDPAREESKAGQVSRQIGERIGPAAKPKRVKGTVDPEMDMALSLPKVDLIPVLNEARAIRRSG